MIKLFTIVIAVVCLVGCSKEPEPEFVNTTLGIVRLDKVARFQWSEGGKFDIPDGYMMYGVNGELLGIAQGGEIDKVRKFLGE